MRCTSTLKCMALAFMVPTIVLLSTAVQGGDVKMEPFYDFRDATITLAPRVYKLGASSSYSLFPVPHDNAVGTNDHADAITIISFPNGTIDLDNYFKKAVHEIYGGGTYLPEISSDMIGFGQVRRFMLYNFKTKTHEEYRIVYSFDDTIERIAIADAQHGRFIFEVEQQNPHSSDHWDITRSLQLIDLSGKEVNVIKNLNIGTVTAWTAIFNRIFLYNLETERLEIVDMNFEPSQHPLGDAINRNRGKLDFIIICPHPSLPFAILQGGKNGSSFLNWGEGRPATPRFLFSGVSQFSFSPDGKWVTFKREDFARDRRMTYLMPVSEKYPNYLGMPMLLWDNSFLRNHFTWTKNPVSFVGSSGGDIYRWELTNEAHPENDRATFHDYIVEKDLERLTKERNMAWGKTNRFNLNEKEETSEMSAD